MAPKTDPIDVAGTHTAPRLSIAPSYTDPVTKQTYVHQDLLATDADWQVENHIPPINRTERFGDVDGWVAYVQQFSDDNRPPFLTWSERGLQAVLDYHVSEDQPGRCQWLAVHDFTRSHAWNVWSLLANGRPRSQREVLELLEDNQADIVDPAPAQLLAVLRTLRATASATADTELLADGSTKVVWQKQTGVKSAELDLPSEFRIAIPVLKGHQAPNEQGKLAPVVYSLAVRIRASVDDQAKLALRLSMPDAERVLEAVFADRVSAAAELLGPEMALYRAADR